MAKENPYWRPTLVLPAEMKEKIKALARDHELEPQDLMREAVLDLFRQTPIAKPPDDILQSLHAITRKLSSAKAELDGVIRRIDRREENDGISDIVAEAHQAEAELDAIVDDFSAFEGGAGESGDAGGENPSRHRRKASGIKNE